MRRQHRIYFSLFGEPRQVWLAFLSVSLSLSLYLYLTHTIMYSSHMTMSLHFAPDIHSSTWQRGEQCVGRHASRLQFNRSWHTRCAGVLSIHFGHKLPFRECSRVQTNRTLTRTRLLLSLTAPRIRVTWEPQQVEKATRRRPEGEAGARRGKVFPGCEGRRVQAWRRWRVSQSDDGVLSRGDRFVGQKRRWATSRLGPVRVRPTVTF